MAAPATNQTSDRKLPSALKLLLVLYKTLDDSLSSAEGNCCVPAAGQWTAAAPRRRPGRGSRPPSASRCGWSAAGWCCRAWRSFHTGPAASAPPGTELGRLRRRQERESCCFLRVKTRLVEIGKCVCIHLNSNARILKMLRAVSTRYAKKTFNRFPRNQMLSSTWAELFCSPLEDTGGELTVSPSRLEVGLMPGLLLAHVDGETRLKTPGWWSRRRKNCGGLLQELRRLLLRFFPSKSCWDFYHSIDRILL